ncbi:MAG: PadR family transcriptional regulator [Anaerolineaceae bacterium]|nr:PadR family transcriptional regulator [Anaerolineaceae bacterium]
MSLQHAILGFLSWKPLTGYELKKMFADSVTVYWSGNNNQIYRTLLDIHKKGFVTKEVQHQDDAPSRKIYTITEAGLEELRSWVLSPPEVPQLKHTFLIQLSWADQLSDDELDHLISSYEDEVHVHLLMLRKQAEVKTMSPERTQRERYLWDMIMQNWIVMYETELQWVRQLRHGLGDTTPERKHNDGH